MKNTATGMAITQDLSVQSKSHMDANPSGVVQREMGAGRDPISSVPIHVIPANKFVELDSGDDEDDGGVFEYPNTEYSEDSESDQDGDCNFLHGGHMENRLSSAPRGTKPIDIVYPGSDCKTKMKLWGRAGRQIGDRERKGDDRREKVWERKRGQVLMEGFVEETIVSDGPQGEGEFINCEGGATPRRTSKTFSRTKSLTDEDLDELKGCLDLGFGFNYDEIPELCNTLPALELCYSISQKFQDDQQKSPVSATDGAMSDTSSNSSSCSYAQSPIANWKISSPGDHPEQVKARLKFWAQAVACTVRLCS